jgi:hypothetical protein
MQAIAHVASLPVVIGLPRRRLLVYQYRLGPNWLDDLDALAATTLHQYYQGMHPTGGLVTYLEMTKDQLLLLGGEHSDPAGRADAGP